MKKGPAIVLAVFTIWPIVYVVVVTVLLYATIMTGNPYLPVGSEIQSGFKVLVTLHMVTILDVAVLFAIYLWHVFNSRFIPHRKRFLWPLYFSAVTFSRLIWKEINEWGNILIRR